MGTRSANIIEARGLAKVYGTGGAAVAALAGVDLSVRRGEFVSIMGPSGSGKSTLLHLLACLQRPSRGTYVLDGVLVDETLSDQALSEIRRRHVGIVFQQHHLLATESLLENAALPLVYAGVGRARRLDVAMRLLEALGLRSRAHHLPTEVSGGQAQRAAIARALAGDPAVVLADEPTGSLDSVAGLEVMGIFQALNREGRTIVQVTHDAEKAQHSTRIVRIRDGRVEDDVPVERPLLAPCGAGWPGEDRSGS